MSPDRSRQPQRPSPGSFKGFACPIFVTEFFANNHKYGALAGEVEAHLAECPVCARKWARLNEEAREWEEDDKPGFRH